jgi:hypothetical protein
MFGCSRRFGLMLGLVLGAVALPAPAEAAATCSEAARGVGVCLGFIEISGLDRYEAAVVGALTAGEHDKAQRFADAIGREAPAVVRSRLREALRRDRSAEGAGRDFLLQRATPTLVPPLTRVGPAAEQDSRGYCCATDAWRWELTPKEWPYGRCAPGEGCPATGSLRIDMRTNIFDFPTIVYDHFFEEASGPRVHIDRMSVKMKRDRSGGPDPTIADYNCPPGNLPLGCGTDTRESGTGVGEYYYIVTGFSGTPQGEPSWAFEFQTRRWKVERGGNAEFPAARAGG